MWSALAQRKHLPRKARSRSLCPRPRDMLLRAEGRPPCVDGRRLGVARDTGSVRLACSNPSIFSLNEAIVGLRMAPSSHRSWPSDNPICNIMQIKSSHPMFAPSASSKRDNNSSMNSKADCPSFCLASKNCFCRACMGNDSKKTLSKIAMHV